MKAKMVACLGFGLSAAFTVGLVTFAGKGKGVKANVETLAKSTKAGSDREFADLRRELEATRSRANKAENHAQVVNDGLVALKAKVRKINSEALELDRILEAKYKALLERLSAYSTSINVYEDFAERTERLCDVMADLESNVSLVEKWRGAAKNCRKVKNDVRQHLAKHGVE